MLRFRTESELYAHFLHYGADKMGVVPHCYGWFDLKDEDVDRASAFPVIQNEDKSDLQPLTITRRPPKGILLEDFPDAMELSTSNITAKIADAALRALYHIHAAYVKHGDIAENNILLLPGGRVVWVGFHNSACAAGDKYYKINRQDLFDELSEAWSFLYTWMVCIYPSKRCV